MSHHYHFAATTPIPIILLLPLILSLLPGLPALPEEPMDPNILRPDPAASFNTFHPNASQPVTIPSFPEQKAFAGCPVSVSLIARHGCDRFLLDTLQTMYPSLQEQGDASMSKSTSNTISRESSAEIAKEKGNQAFKDKQWQKAISFYSEAIKFNGNNATYYSNRAAAYLELGSFVQAEADCTNAINLDKKNVKAYLRRGTAREMLSYYKDAIEDFRYALVLEPTNKRASVSAERLKNLFQ